MRFQILIVVINSDSAHSSTAQLFTTKRTKKIHSEDRDATQAR